MKRSDKDRIDDMIAECKFLIELKEKSYIEELIDDPVTGRAIERALEIIGESARGLSEEFRQMYSFIDWKSIIGLRNVIVHQYFRVDKEIIADILENKLPKFLSQIENIRLNLE